jgi:DNA-binding response OmpR family regulator
MTNALMLRGHDVVEVSDGLGLIYQALFGWRDVFDKPDLVLAETRLAGWSGFELMDYLRDAAVTTPFLFIARCGSAAERSDAVRRGANIVEKPTDLDGLCEIVGRAAAG